MIQHSFSTQRPKDFLKEWAWFPDYQKMIKDLQELVLTGENWFYGSQRDANDFPILVSYLHYTFYRLIQEEKNGEEKIRTENKYAAFNTGLVDDLYEPIYAIFEKNNRVNAQPYKFLSFCVEGIGFFGNELTRNFNPFPQKAKYFALSDVLYNTEEPYSLRHHHIIVERTYRLPYTFLETKKPNNFDFKEIASLKSLTKEKKEEYFKNLGEAINSDKATYRFLKNRLDDAIKLAIKRVSWNYKTAIPTYFPTENKLSLLLPLCLVADDVVDAAIVMEKTTSNAYIGHTVLSLEMAYSNARLVSRPDSDWLKAETSLSTTSIDIED